MKPFSIPDPKEIDAEIRGLISLLNERDEFCTFESCAGHTIGERPKYTYVGIAVCRFHGIKELAKALNAIEATPYFNDVLLDCSLLWFLQFGDGVHSSLQPGWIWFTLTFQGGGGNKLILGKRRLDRMVRVLRKHFKGT